MLTTWVDLSQWEIVWSIPPWGFWFYCCILVYFVNSIRIFNVINRYLDLLVKDLLLLLVQYVLLLGVLKEAFILLGSILLLELLTLLFHTQTWEIFYINTRTDSTDSRKVCRHLDEPLPDWLEGLWLYVDFGKFLKAAPLFNLQC